ncbi:hypothetical protein K2Y11_20390 [bacterium]|nr:hypothetical protein [bacterium]
MAAKKKSAPAPEKRKWSPPSGRKVLGAGLFILVIALAAATPFALHHSRHALRSILHQGKALTISANPSPAWIKSDLVADAKARLALIERERAVTAADVGQAFDRSPWVRSVRIKRTPTGYRVEADYREPILGVALRDRCCFTDREGVALDPTTLKVAAGANCLTVNGIDVGSPPRAGHRLDNPLVTRVGQLASLLWDLREPLELDLIIVRPHHGANPTMFELKTLSGGRIIWGDFGAQDAVKLAQLTERARNRTPLAKEETLDLTPSSTSNPSGSLSSR